jgi:hypothetical protein
MRSPIEPKMRARRQESAGVCLCLRGWLPLALVLAASTSAQAVGGRAEVRTNHQEGRVGAESYSSDNRWELVGLDEMIRFSRASSLRLEYTARRELLRGTSAGTSVENHLVVLTPAVNLSWQLEGLRLSAHGRGNRIDRDDTGLPTQRDDSLEYGLWSNARRGRLLLDFSLQDNASWRRTAGDDRENRERSGRATARYSLSAGDEVNYQYSRVDLDAVTLGHRSIFSTHQFQYRGDHGFAADRGRVSVTLLHSRFKQRNIFDAVVSEQYVLPETAAWYLDDTPGQLDPLENRPQTLTSLIDNDRTTPTVINLGDNAPPGRDQGGDYRNLLLDFGEPQAVGAASLYVDRRLTFLPGLMAWDLYFSDDAEGFDWGLPVPADQWSATWFELETGRQGWEIRFSNGEVTHRRLKLVNRKLGPTMGDLYVTEFEAFTTAQNTEPERTGRQDRTMLNGELAYALHPKLRFRYGTSLDRRDQGGDTGRLERANNSATLDWNLDSWLLSGQFQTSRETRSGGRETDSNNRLLSLSRRAPGRLDASLSWMVTQDDNYNARYRTEAISADATWRAAPALVFTQKASRGWRQSDRGTGDSDSWVLSSEVRSSPRPSLRLDLRRTERWVSQEAGVGFTTYSESEADASWDILPLLTWSGQVVSQKRDDRDLMVRNSLAWTPLPGGSLALSFQANDYRDSRTDQQRRGAGATVDWRPRPRLTLTGSVDKSYERLAGRESWPVSFQFRGYWTF